MPPACLRLSRCQQILNPNTACLGPIDQRQTNLLRRATPQNQSITNINDAPRAFR